MVNSRLRLSILVTAWLTGSLLSACGGDETPPDPAEVKAGRETGDSMTRQPADDAAERHDHDRAQRADELAAAVQQRRRA